MKNALDVLPPVALLLVSSTMVFLVVLIPAMIVRFQITNIEFVTIAMMILISTAASTVALLLYVLLTKELNKKKK